MKPLPATVDVGGVLASGRTLTLDENVTLPEFGDFRFPEPLRVRLDVRRSGGALEVAGTVDGFALGSCTRCLDEVRLPIAAGIEERFTPDDAGPLGDGNVLAGDHLDVADLVRQAIDSSLPLGVLCDEECSGLCPTCGTKRDGGCRCTLSEIR